MIMKITGVCTFSKHRGENGRWVRINIMAYLTPFHYKEDRVKGTVLPV